RCQVFRATVQRGDVVQSELTDRGALEVMTALPRLDQTHRAPRAADRQRKAGDPSARAQIRDRIRVRQDLAQRGGLEQQPLCDRDSPAMSSEIDALAPALQKQGELHPPLE